MRPIFVVAFLSVLFTTSIATNCCPPRRTANSDQFLQLQQTFGTGIICTCVCWIYEVYPILTSACDVAMAVVPTLDNVSTYVQ